MKMKCNICRKARINYDGAILISPPNKKMQCRKAHICKECYKYYFLSKFIATSIV